MKNMQMQFQLKILPENLKESQCRLFSATELTSSISMINLTSYNSKKDTHIEHLHKYLHLSFIDSLSYIYDEALQLTKKNKTLF